MRRFPAQEIKQWICLIHSLSWFFSPHYSDFRPHLFFSLHLISTSFHISFVLIFSSVYFHTYILLYFNFSQFEMGLASASIILTGGNVKFKNFGDRFYSELRPLVPDIFPVNVSRNTIFVRSKNFFLLGFHFLFW